MSKFKGVKTNNAKTSAKREIREAVLSKVESPSVLEVFCGSGEMYQSVWHKADNYTGIDKVKQFDSRHTVCGDAEKAIRIVDLRIYNIFDIDAYGSPYEVLARVLGSVSPEWRSVGFVLTDGIAMDLKLGRICKGVRMLTGINGHIAKRAHVLHDEIISMVIDKVADSICGSVSMVKMATGKTGSQMKYYGFVVTRNAV